jgi:pyruvate/2-oxoglutarate dehydrogenase complex dihydrolipoamide dehydrogenase (E3) component
MARHNFNYDLIVIGSGAGGSAAASITARSGKRVALIETDTFGGTSANFSDVPTKALLHAAKLYDHAKHGQQFGIRSGAVGYNYPSIKAWKDLVVKRTGAGANQRYYQSQGIDMYHGLAHLISPHEISVNRRHISAEYILIATGANWQVPNKIQGLDKIEYLTPRSALDLIRPPKSLFIIGGGSTGLELAQLFSSFGTKTYVADIAPRLLPSEDTAVSELIESYLHEHKGITPLTQARVTKVTKEGLLKRVSYTTGKTEKSVKVDEILIAAGKNPMVDLGLENAEVEYTPRGIEVNEHLQTSAKHIYAAGDVLGTNMYTHVALLESRVAAHNIFNRSKISPNYTAIPRITYVDPEVASTGLSEDDCIKRDLPINQAIAPLNITARANISNEREGFAKVITDKKGVVLGGTVVAPNAGEIIHELTLAVQYGLTARDIANTIHAFPSWSEVVRVAAAKLA